MDLKGTQTEKNLWLAFSGESQAIHKYSFYSQKAQEEGYEDVAALFAEIARQEVSHAQGLYVFLQGIKDTLTNLKRSAEGEHYESTTLFKEYERVAREEGFDEIAEYFKNLRIKEAEHEQVFLAALKKLKQEPTP